MPVCSRCGKQGLFVRISKWNVCSSCQRGIEEFAAERMEVCSADLKAAEASSSGEMRARYLDQALAALSDLRVGLSLDLPLREAIELGRD